MANTEITDKNIKPRIESNKPIILKARIDCSLVNDGAGVDQSDEPVYEMIDIPAGLFVEKVWVEVETVEDSTCTFDVGDGDDPNGWNDAINAESAAVSFSITGTDAYATAAGKQYTSADTIDITFDNDADTAVINVFALCYVIDNRLA